MKNAEENKVENTLTMKVIGNEDGGLTIKMEVSGFKPLEIVGILQLQINDILSGLNSERNRDHSSIPFSNGGNFEA